MPSYFHRVITLKAKHRRHQPDKARRGHSISAPTIAKGLEAYAYIATMSILVSHQRTRQGAAPYGHKNAIHDDEPRLIYDNQRAAIGHGHAWMINAR